MKSLNQYIQEKLIINKDYKDAKIVVKSFNELRKIIDDRYNEFGAGTKQKPINFNDIDVSGINSFCNSKGKGIFGYTGFKYIDISDWDVSNIEDMRNMFKECAQLKSVGDLSNWNVSNVKDMSYMFYICVNLTSVGDLSDWDVSNIEDIGYMFFGCEQLKSVGNLSNWDVSNVEDMFCTFEYSGITNIPKWYK